MMTLQVVDMFGSGLPVCAADYKCIDELVVDGQNGSIFSSAEELARCLSQMLTNFPLDSTKCLNMKKSMQKAPLAPWDDDWHRIMLPIVKGT